MAKREGEISITKLGRRTGPKLEEHVKRLIELRDIEKSVKEEFAEINEKILPIMQKLSEGTVVFPFARLSLYENETVTTLDKKKLVGVMLAKGFKQAEIDEITAMASNITQKKPYVKLGNGTV